MRCGAAPREWFAGHVPHICTINSLAYDVCNEFGGAGRLRVLNEMDARRLIEATFDIRRRSNADVLAPYLEALSAIRLQLMEPAVAEGMFPDAAGIGDGFDRYRPLSRRPAPLILTSRSTGPLRSSSLNRMPVRRPGRDAAPSWWTSSKT